MLETASEYLPHEPGPWLNYAGAYLEVHWVKNRVLSTNLCKDMLCSCDIVDATEREQPLDEAREVPSDLWPWSVLASC